MNRCQRQRGAALLSSIIVLLPIVALGVAGVMLSKTSLVRQDVDRRAARALTAAFSAMDVAQTLINNATYADPAYPDQNLLLAAAIDQNDQASLWLRNQGPVLEARFLDLATSRRVWFDADQIGAIPPTWVPFRRLDQVDLGAGIVVPLFVAPVTAAWFTIEAPATVAGITRTASVLVRGRDPFTRYSIFTDQGEQPISVPISGDIHSNGSLRMMYGNWDLPDFVSAVSGFNWTYGADWSNVGFLSGYNESADPITLPDLAALQARVRPAVALPNAAEVAGDYIYVGSDYDSVSVQFSGSTVVVDAVQAGVPQTVYSGPLAGIDRIYALPPITALGGDLDGQLSVVSESTDGILITDNLRYVDGDGDLAMLDTSSVSSYHRNPAYDGASSLGLLAPQGSVRYGYAAPAVLEVHAAVYADAQMPDSFEVVAGQIEFISGSNFLRDRLFTLGTTVTRYGKIRGLVGSGGSLTSGYDEGTYLYDRSLLDRPPPYFLDLERPHFKAFTILEGTIAS